MAFTQVPNKLARTSSVSVYAKAVFLVIASYNPSFPSYKVIVEQTGLSKGTVAKAIKELRDRRLLTYTKGSLRSKKANEYIITHESSWDLVESSVYVVDREIDILVQDDSVIGLCGEPTSVYVVDSNNTKNNTNTICSKPDEPTTIESSNPENKEEQSSVNVVNREKEERLLNMQCNTWKELTAGCNKAYNDIGLDLQQHCILNKLNQDLEVIKYAIDCGIFNNVIKTRLVSMLVNTEGVISEDLLSVLATLHPENAEAIVTEAKTLYPRIAL